MKLAFPVLIAIAATAFVNGPQEDRTDAVAIRKTLTSLVEIQDNNQFLLEFANILRKHHIDFLLRKGDRVQIGKATLVFEADGQIQLRSSADRPTATKTLAHYVTEQGDLLQEKSTPENATHFVLATGDAVFVIDLRNQRMAVVKK